MPFARRWWGPALSFSFALVFYVCGLFAVAVGEFEGWLFVGAGVVWTAVAIGTTLRRLKHVPEPSYGADPYPEDRAN
jgi:hypothetical protein